VTAQVVGHDMPAPLDHPRNPLEPAGVAAHVM
jgi:hypothetical protein